MPHDRCIVGCCEMTKGTLPVNKERQKAWILHTVSKKEEKILRNQNILKYVQIISLRESQLNVIQIQHYF